MPVERSSPDRLRTFFLSMTNRSFGQLGIGDRRIAEYMATVLSDFSRADRWAPLRDTDGKRLTSVIEMLMARLAPGGEQRMAGERMLRKYVGDYTLFMAGLFRRYVERGGFLDYYLAEGKRSYQAVSALDLALYRPGFLMFEELSRGFEGYAFALDYMRKCFFASAPGSDPFAGFFRQIDGWVRRGLPDN